MKKRFTNKPLLWQITVIFLFSIIVAMIFIAIIGYKNNTLLYINKMGNDNRNLANYVLKELKDTSNVEWLFPYWENNYKEMDIVYDDIEITRTKKKKLAQAYPGIDFSAISTEELDSLPEDIKRLYAEVKYMEMTDLFDNLKRIYHPKYLYCFNIVDDANLFYFVTALDEGEYRGDTIDSIYKLGSLSEYSPSIYPVLQKTYETGMVQNELEQPFKTGDGKCLYHIYLPVTNEAGQVLAFIGVTLESNKVQKEVATMLFKGEINTFIIFILCGFILVGVVTRVIILPLRLVQNEVKKYSANKDKDAIVNNLLKISSKNEIGQVSNEISAMATEIERYTNDILALESEKKRIGVELDIATKIQLGMLPSKFPAFPDRNEFDVFATMTAAKEVGGDFYDFFFVDSDHLALVIADVSGKGVPAALFMMVAKVLIKTRAQMGGSPSEILADVNNRLCESNDSGFFVTVWLCIIELSTGKVVESNAGHECPCIKHKDGDFEIVKYKHSPAVSTIEGIKFRQYEYELKAGDRLYVYTDGVCEATNANNELYGEERMLNALNNNKDVSLKELLYNMKSDIDNFVGDAPQFDDVTMLVIDYFGKN